MQAADLTTRKVVSISPGTFVAETVRLMLQDDITGPPAVDQADHLVGVATEGGLLRSAETGTVRHGSSHWRGNLRLRQVVAVPNG